MATPRVHGHAANFVRGTAATFLIHGKSFVGDGAGHVDVLLSCTDPHPLAIWPPRPVVGKVLDVHWVEVTATPIVGGKPAAGVGDLTITVTNGDGSGASNTSSQDVYYK